MLSRGKLSLEESSELMSAQGNIFSPFVTKWIHNIQMKYSLLQFWLLSFSKDFLEYPPYAHRNIIAAISSAIRMVLVHIVILSGSTFEQLELWNPWHATRNAVFQARSQNRKLRMLIFKSYVVHLVCGCQFHFFR